MHNNNTIKSDTIKFKYTYMSNQTLLYTKLLMKKYLHTHLLNETSSQSYTHKYEYPTSETNIHKYLLNQIILFIE